VAADLLGQMVVGGAGRPAGTSVDHHAPEGALHTLDV